MSPIKKILKYFPSFVLRGDGGSGTSTIGGAGRRTGKGRGFTGDLE